MHTYLKHDSGAYSVGMWLPNLEGITSFTALFTVETWLEAVQAVNYLNGGHAVIDSFHETMVEK